MIEYIKNAKAFKIGTYLQDVFQVT